MDDLQLAKEIIKRLNKLLESNEDVRAFLQTFFDENYIPVGEQRVLEHPTIQHAITGGVPCIGPLGVLNGIVGVVTDNSIYKDWGYIAACYSGDGRLFRFSLVTEPTPVADHV